MWCGVYASCACVCVCTTKETFVGIYFVTVVNKTKSNLWLEPIIYFPPSSSFLSASSFISKTLRQEHAESLTDSLEFHSQQWASTG